MGAIGAAVITGLLSLVGLIISKENKTSEFRQQWIDGFREELSDLIGRIEVILLHGRLLHFEVNKKHGGVITPELLNDCMEKIKDEVKEAHSLHRKLLLRLNPNEHQNIRKIMDDIATALCKNMPEEEEVSALLNKLVETTQMELKKEWTRVKTGEPVFRTTKWAALIFILVMSVYLVLRDRSVSTKAQLATGKAQAQVSSVKSSSDNKVTGH